MVATRRGVRVYSPTKTNSDESSGVQATPSTGRRTRRTAKQVETPAQPSQEKETCCQPDEEEGGPPVSPESQSSTGTRRSRCTRASRLHSPEPSTPVDSTHEADASDLESCCSAVSDIEPPTIYTRGRRRQSRAVSQEGDDIHSSAMPASKEGQSARRGTRTTRKKNVLESSDPAHVELGDGDAGTVTEAESCCSVVSESQRVTRSQRKSAPTRSSAKQPTEDPQLSETDSCASSVSGAQVSTSTTGRATRSRRGRPALMQPIPMHLDEVSEGSQSPAPSGQRTRAGRRKPAAAVVVSEPQSCDSEGFMSGPSATPRRSTRRRGKAESMDVMATDSDSELTDVHSPLGSTYSTQGGGTPSSSRTGSGNSSQVAPATRLSFKTLRVVLNTPGAMKGEEPGEGEPAVTMPMAEDSLLNDTRLDSTVSADPDCTVFEEDKTLTLEDEDEEEGVTSTDLASKDAPPEDAEVIEVGHRGSVIMSTTTPADVEMSETSALHPSSVQEESTDTTETEKGVTVITVEDEKLDTPADSEDPLSRSVIVSDSPTEEAETVPEPEVTAGEQQREPLAGDEDGDVSEMIQDVSLIQETAPPTEPAEPTSSQSVTVTECERPATSGDTEEMKENVEAMEMDEVNTRMDGHPSQSGSLDDRPVDGDAAVETLPDGKEGVEDPAQSGSLDDRPVDGDATVETLPDGEEGMEDPAQSGSLDDRPVDGDAAVETLPDGKEGVEDPAQSGSLDDRPVDGDAAVETLPDGEEGMEVSTSSTDAQQTVGSSEVPPSPSEPTQAESIQVTSSQKPNVTVSDTELEARDSVIVQKTGVISLLESSEEEGSGEEEEEDLVCMNEEQAGPSERSQTATASAEGLFVIDTRPGLQADGQYYMAEGPSGEGAGTEMAEGEEQDEEEFVDEEGGDDDEDEEILFRSRNPHLKELSSRIDPGLRVKELGGLYINFDGSKSKPVSGSLKKLKEQKIQDEVMKKSVIGPDFEKKEAVPPYSESKRALKLKRKEEREKTTGDGWFNMKAPELTQELKGDLNVLKMRGAMDPKRFYKKNDRDGFPKYFQVGTVVDSPADFYHSRLPKKERKRTMVEELLADAEFRHNNKKKYQKIMIDKAAHGAGKRNKKKSKFRKK